MPTQQHGPLQGLRLGADLDPQRIISERVFDGKTEEEVDIRYQSVKVVGNGSFGVVFQVKLVDNGKDAAIKRVLQDKRFKNRELQIMKLISHPNVVDLKYYFFCPGERQSEVYLNLILEYVPENLYRCSRSYSKMKQSMPMLEVKLYMYQCLRSLAYIHSMGICHRDIKPQNLLLDPARGILKLCDFGSAKILVKGEPNVSYICSRYYRAPELIFGATDYTTFIDIWSTGCVMAELLTGTPLFPGESGIDQLVEIIKVLGTPSKEQIRTMNPNYMEHKFPQIKPHPFNRVLRRQVGNEVIDLLKNLLQYTPTARLPALDALTHEFFDELRDPSTKLPDARSLAQGNLTLPDLFNFTIREMSIKPELNEKLVPLHARPQLGFDLDNFTPMRREELRVTLD